jgi:hypothetical protein
VSQESEDLVAVLPLYRRLGFFASLSHMSDAELATHLRDQYNRNPAGIELRTNFPGWDLALLGMDEDRSWTYDTECVWKDDKVYAELVDRVARISRGTFQPSDVDEIWDGPMGPIHLRFRLGGQLHQVVMGEMETDFMEVGPLTYLEELVKASTPYELVHLVTGDQTDFIVLMTPGEREQLESERPALFDVEGAYG